jgi:hypothetical protein
MRAFLREAKMYPLLTNVVCQFEDRNGKPLAGGKVFTYEANTTTPKLTYADPEGNTPNTNPVILDQAGRAKIYADSGAYRVQVFDARGVLIVDTNKLSRYVTSLELDEYKEDVQGGLDELHNVQETLNTVTETAINNQKDQPDGVPGLNDEGLIDPARLPAATDATQGAVKLVDNLDSESDDAALTAKMGKKLNAEKLSIADFATGDAPVFAARAWVNFNGSNGEIRKSGNIASVVRNGHGNYTITFTKPMPHKDYTVIPGVSYFSAGTNFGVVSQTTDSLTLQATYGGDNTIAPFDPVLAMFAVFC